MKKFLSFTILILLLFTLCSCGNYQKNDNFSSEMHIRDDSDVTIIEVP